MRLIGLAVILAVSLTLAPRAAEGQPAGNAPQVGVLLLDTEARGLSQRARYFVEGLRELGWNDGQNIALRFRFAALNKARFDPPRRARPDGLSRTAASTRE